MILLDKPCFTIIVTTYRGEDFLQRALGSVQCQEWKDFHCLVINDNPLKNSSVEEAVAALNDSRFRFIASSRNRGANYCRNEGIRLAEGTYIAFLDDDDIWFPQKLKLHLEEHQANSSILVYSDYVKKYSGPNDLEIPTAAPEVPDDIPRGMFDGLFSIGTTSSVTLRRTGLPEPLFDEALVSFQDWDAWLTIARSRKDVLFSHIRQPLLFFVQHDQDRTSTNSGRREQGLKQIVAKYGGKQHLKGFYYKEWMNIYLLKAGEKKGWRGRIFLVRQFIVNPGLWLNLYAIKKLVKYLFSVR